MSSVESNLALVITNMSLRSSLRWIRHSEADGRVAVDQAHKIAHLVSNALQQHGRNASVISLFLLSAAAKVRATMNKGLKPQWDCVQDDDPHMETHPFFPKTIRYASKPAPQVAPAPAAEVMLVPPINSLPLSGHQKTDKGKPPDRGTRRPREDSPGAELGRKKCKVLKPLSKAVVSNTEDEDRQPGGAIVVKKASKIAEPAPVAPPKSKGTTKGIKKFSPLNHSQKDAEDPIGRPLAKGKGKQKAKEVAEPVRGRQLAKADAEMIIQSTMPEMCQQALPCPHRQERAGHEVLPEVPHHEGAASMPHPRSKAALASKSKVSSRTTRATFCAHPLTPTPEPEQEAVKETDEADIKPNANAEQHTDVETKVPVDEKMVVNEPQVIASADDFPADHWAEPHSNGIPTPPATTVPLPPASLLPTVSTIHKRMLALTAQVAAMQLANQNALARVDAMEQDFNTHISSMRAELSSMQFDVGATITLVNGLVCLVEKLWQDHVIPNPSFPAPVISPANASTATAMGYRYLNGVFGPSVGPLPMSVGVGKPSVSRPFGCPDMQGTTFMSGQVSSVSAPAGPSNTVPSPASAAHSLP
ncbi:hypothetical protein DFH29DRAFT_878203 [Suillus ampliporus]|nr:hypothetical protein DFH29DRAFT_878203 [Suillus ampliporus]